MLMMLFKVREKSRLLLRASLGAICFLAAGNQGWALGIASLCWEPAEAKPGSAVFLRLKGGDDLVTAAAWVGGEEFPLVCRDGGCIGLFGVDPGFDQPFFPVELEAYAPVGEPARLVAFIPVKYPEKPARSQKLSLPKSKVDLSESDQERVEMEAELIRGAFSGRRPETLWTEPFLLPLEGRISTRFGTGRVLNGQPRSVHYGVDLATPRGTPVGAANRGAVVLVGDFFLTGNTVVLDHGWGVFTVYAHLDGVAAREGEILEKGEIVGTVGSTGRSTGPHLHYGTSLRGARVDPLTLLLQPAPASTTPDTPSEETMGGQP